MESFCRSPSYRKGASPWPRKASDHYPLCDEIHDWGSESRHIGNSRLKILIPFAQSIKSRQLMKLRLALADESAGNNRRGHDERASQLRELGKIVETQTSRANSMPGSTERPSTEHWTSVAGRSPAGQSTAGKWYSVYQTCVLKSRAGIILMKPVIQIRQADSLPFMILTPSHSTVASGTPRLNSFYGMGTSSGSNYKCHNNSYSDCVSTTSLGLIVQKDIIL